jgi:hypothetical protein
MYRQIILIAALLSPQALFALNSRSAVSINGVDTNPCTVVSPCRTFTQAINSTATDGEVVALDSGGFGAFSVYQGVTVEGAPGVYAGVTAASGDAITVGNSGTVTLRNLVINGLGTGMNGIFKDGGAGSIVHIENCTVENFSSIGIYSFGFVTVTDSTIRNVNAGAYLYSVAPRTATLTNVSVSDASEGIGAVQDFTVTVRNSIVTHASLAFVAFNNSVLTIDSCVISHNTGDAVVAGAGGTVRISNNLITGNAIGVDGAVESWGNNNIAGNTTNVNGTLTSIAQQ